jgi:hypothetical protein
VFLYDGIYLIANCKLSCLVDGPSELDTVSRKWSAFVRFSTLLSTCIGSSVVYNMSLARRMTRGYQRGYYSICPEREIYEICRVLKAFGLLEDSPDGCRMKEEGRSDCEVVHSHLRDCEEGHGPCCAKHLSSSRYEYYLILCTIMRSQKCKREKR